VAVRPLEDRHAPDASALLVGLDPDQKNAVTAPPGLVVVRAGAGSGKTRVLTTRIAWRAANESAETERTLAFTFTRQAASELRARLRDVDMDAMPAVGTFHAVARRLMIQDLQDRGRRVPVIASNRSSLMSTALGEAARAGGVAEALAAYDWIRARGEDSTTALASWRASGRRLPVSDEKFASVIAAYDAEKRRRGIVDLDDFLVHVVERCTRDARFAESVRFQFRHVLVDEAQDMNPLQWSFVRMLAGDDPDLFLVGDPNQAIYGFNGADHSIFDTLPGIDRPARVMSLPSNYRCTPEVVTFAVGALARDGQTADAASVRPPGPAVRLERCGDERAEVDAVVGHVRRLAGAVQSYDGVAVLARVNTLADDVRLSLERSGIPVRNPRQGGAWGQAVQTATSLTSRDALATWSSDILDGGDYRDDDPEHVVAGHVRHFLDEHRHSAVDGRTFGSWLATTGDPDTGSGVDVLTFHAAKGREWPAVVVVGAEKGLLPHRSARGAEARGEEARLAYVAFTRAGHELVVTWTDSRSGKSTGPSPLLPRLTTATVPAGEPVAEIRHIADRSRTRDAALAAVTDWRARRARASRSLPEAVLTDRQLRRLAGEKNHTIETIAAIVDPMFAERFGTELIELLSDAAR
jgi:DNA helicase-2/ATP-dependent DNA helicase PcrA